MYLSASEVAVSTMGRYNKCSTFTFTFDLLHPTYSASQTLGPTSKVSEGGCKGEVTGKEGRDGRQWREGGKGTHEKCEF